MKVRLSKTWGKYRGKVFEFSDGTSDEEIKQIVKKQLGLPPDWKPTKIDIAKETTKRAVTETAGKAREFLGGIGQQFYGGQKEMLSDTSRLLGVQPAAYEPTPEARGIPQKAARIVGGLSAPVGGVPGGGIVPGAIKGIMRTSRAYPKIARAGQAIRRGAEETGAFVGNILSSVPREHFKMAFQKDLFKKSIFNKEVADREFQKVGKVAQEALKKVNLDAGKEVSKQNSLLSDLQKRVGKNIQSIESKDVLGKKSSFSPKKYAERIEEMASEFKSENVDLLSVGDRKMLGYIKNTLKKNPEIKDIQNLKKKIYNFSKFPLESIRPPSKEGDRLFKNIANDFKNTMSKVSPALGKANIQSSKMQKLRDRLRVDLKDKSITRRFKNLETQDVTTLDLLKELDEVAPKSLKFLERAKELVAQKSFQEVFPGRGGGSGGVEGIKNIARVALGSQASNAARLGLFPLMSPKINEFLIRGGKRALRPREPFRPRPIRGLIKRGAVRTGIREMAPDKNPDGTFTDSFRRGLVTDDPRRSF